MQHKKILIITFSLIIIIMISSFISIQFFGGKERIQNLEKKVGELQSRVKEKKLNDKYEFASISKGDVVQTVEVDGTIVADSEVDINFQVGGRLEGSFKEVGDQVKKGDLIANLESIDYELLLERGQAGLAQAKANLNIALAGSTKEDIKVYETALASASNILEDTQVSSNNMVATQEAQVIVAKAALDTYETALRDLRKKSEIDIANVYSSSDIAVDTILTSVESALDATYDIIELEELEDLFSVKNSGYQAEYDDYYNQAHEKYELIAASIEEDTMNTMEIIKMLDDDLDLTLLSLNSLFNGLVNTVTSNSMSQTMLESLKAEVNTIRSGINLAISNLESAKQAIILVETVVESKINNAEANLVQAEATLSSTEANLKSAKANRDVAITQAESSLDLARDKLALVKSGPRDVDIAYLNAIVYEASSVLSLAKENLGKTKLYAPIDGTITALNTEVGENINQAGVFCSIVSDYKQIEAIVPETEIGKIQVSQDVRIEFDAYEDDFFDGVVASIDPSETIKQGIVYYKIKILISEENEKNIMPGMTAEATIKTAGKTDVLRIAKSLLKQGMQGPYVNVLEDDSVQEVALQTGLAGDAYVEIISGIDESVQIIALIKEEK